jgi:hypothetical protein
MRRAKNFGNPVDELGLVVEERKGVAKVIFPQTGPKIHTFLKDKLEVINESR